MSNGLSICYLWMRQGSCCPVTSRRRHMKVVTAWRQIRQYFVAFCQQFHQDVAKELGQSCPRISKNFPETPSSCLHMCHGQNIVYGCVWMYMGYSHQFHDRNPEKRGWKWLHGHPPSDASTDGLRLQKSTRCLRRSKEARQMAMIHGHWRRKRDD